MTAQLTGNEQPPFSTSLEFAFQSRGPDGQPRNDRAFVPRQRRRQHAVERLLEDGVRLRAADDLYDPDLAVGLDAPDHEGRRADDAERINRSDSSPDFGRMRTSLETRELG